MRETPSYREIALQGEANRSPVPKRRAHPDAGFSLIEILFVMVVAMVMAAMAIPQTRAAMASYELSAAVESASGAIQSTRYQAIMHGYEYELAFDNTANTFQVLNEVPPAAAFTNVNSAVPISGDAITVSASPTFLFKPNGSVSAVSGTMSFTISYRGTTKTLTVSNYGSISIQ
jgi:Tfp pilus assembly protein FimT